MSLSLPLPEPVEAAEALRSYAAGHGESLLSKLEGMALGTAEGEQEYWQEERDRVKKYALKIQRYQEKGPRRDLQLGKVE